MVTNSHSAGNGALAATSAQIGLASTAPAALPMRARHLAIARVVELYMANYAGRDATRAHRLTWWSGAIGAVALQDVTDDHVHVALEALAHKTATDCCASGAHFW
jgi:hypothetical protein